MDISIIFIVMVKTNIFGAVLNIININAVRVLQVPKMKQVNNIIVLYKYYNLLSMLIYINY